MIYECTPILTGGRFGKRVEHQLSDELTPKEALTRLGILGGRWHVTRWPNGRPDQARVVQDERGLKSE